MPGLKDSKAITRQTISLPLVNEDRLSTFDLEGITILDAKRHTNKLRLGHLRGNRFFIRIHDVVADADQKALDILHILEHTGVPNFFGPQRYGVFGTNHLVGQAILQGEFKTATDLIIGDPSTISNERWQTAAAAYRADDIDQALQAFPGRFRDERRLLHSLLKGLSHQQAVLGLPRKLLRLFLSAYQSHFFDRQVAMRLETLDVLWPGDIAYIHAKGACFRVEDPQTEQPRVDRLEISPTGLTPRAQSHGSPWSNRHSRTEPAGKGADHVRSLHSLTRPQAQWRKKTITCSTPPGELSARGRYAFNCQLCSADRQLCHQCIARNHQICCVTPSQFHFWSLLQLWHFYC